MDAPAIWRFCNYCSSKGSCIVFLQYTVHNISDRCFFFNFEWLHVLASTCICELLDFFWDLDIVSIRQAGIAFEKEICSILGLY